MGYIWLAFSYHQNVSNKNDFGICMFKQVTNIPCPSCGSTRSIIALIHGDVLGSLKWNPIGVILMLGMVILPFWVVYDKLTKKTSLVQVYNQSETFLKQKSIAIPAIILVLLNWMWNIYKGL